MYTIDYNELQKTVNEYKKAKESLDSVYKQLERTIEYYRMAAPSIIPEIEWNKVSNVSINDEDIVINYTKFMESECAYGNPRYRYRQAEARIPKSYIVDNESDVEKIYQELKKKQTVIDEESLPRHMMEAYFNVAPLPDVSIKDNLSLMVAAFFRINYIHNVRRTLWYSVLAMPEPDDWILDDKDVNGRADKLKNSLFEFYDSYDISDFDCMDAGTLEDIVRTSESYIALGKKIQDYIVWLRDPRFVEYIDFDIDGLAEVGNYVLESSKRIHEKASKRLETNQKLQQKVYTTLFDDKER
jgi:hypothetical protein